jgi:dipeptidyl-peptidase-3
MSRQVLIPLMLSLLIGMLGCGKPKPPTEQPELIERVDNIAVLSMKAPGFDKLSLQDKQIAYHLCRAAIAGRDLAYDQNHLNALEIRNLLEEIILHPQGTPWEVLENITTFLKKFWTHTGQYDPVTSRKFLPSFTYRELLTAADSAFNHGADFGVDSIDHLHAKIEKLHPTLFDRDFDPILTNKSPTPPNDILTGSAVNHYHNISLQEADNFPELYPLNSRLVKDNTGIHEEVYRSGSPNLPPGRMAQTVAAVVEELDKARMLARPSQQKALTHLIRYLETGDLQEFRQANIAWVADNSPVDYTIGFIEVYHDPRGQKGTYEGLVYFVDSTRTELMQKLAEHAAQFENLAPWDPQFKNPKPKSMIGRAVNVLVAVGDAGPTCPHGINLPNEEALRATYGSKSVALTNVRDGSRLVWGNATTREFAENDHVIQQWEQWGDITSFLTLAMHEIIGHGSGKMSPDLEGSDADYLKEYASTLEEARADLMALYFIIHPLSQDLGIVPDPACGEAAYRRYIRSDLVNLNWVGDANKIMQDHDRGHHMIVEYLRHVTGAVDTLRHNGKLYLIVTDLDQAHHGVAELLGKVMRIKATGDYQGAKQLIETYGVPLNPAWRDEVQHRMAALDLPDYTAYIMPESTLDALPLGRVNDVNISYPRDFMVQMLTYAGKIPAEE